tara:strand:+ start:615 stop:827 length:213 start_codon:yes stop_codon:yes gene_type:complete
MISEEMYNVMMHMIGYGQLDRNFTDAISAFSDHDLLLELAQNCNGYWGSDSVNIELLKKNIKMYNEDGDE